MPSLDFLPVDVLLKILKRIPEEFTPHSSDHLNISTGDDGNEPYMYLKSKIIPTLQSALLGLLDQVSVQDVLLKHHSAFDALNYLTLELYRNNPSKRERLNTVRSMEDIPWVVEYWKSHPPTRKPLSWYLTFAEAATIIQKHWRAFMVRRQKEVQELRNWQLEWRRQIAQETLSS